MIRLTISAPEGYYFVKSETEPSVAKLDGVPLTNAAFNGPWMYGWGVMTVDVPAELLATKHVAKVTVTTPAMGTSNAFDFPIQ